ncbi:hypothetical protein SAMN05444422_11517 [Halobiforma haloterrestris]|uniref:Polyketide cyclase / dehydrase and lipid transport n=2 Tax=Natronobacterium haloterrestre TaxID=148448 RepID=A0A1I1L8N6_NATHA|nr:hypothetical protein SAMN05444422_11517 [Halobiforma haloterrestris]
MDPDQTRTVKRRVRQAVGAGVIGALYWVGLRPRMMTWGATPGETTRQLPGDDLLPEPDGESTMSIGIDAPPGDVWPWLLQLGQERGGFYSYTWAENLLGFDIHNADEIIPSYQDLAVGDTVRLARADRFPETKLEVASMAPEKSLVLQTPDQPPWWVWAFVLAPVGPTETRLIVRARIRLPQNPAATFTSQLVLDPVTFVMTRGMLRGIKSRVENAVNDAYTADVEASDSESNR